VTDVRGNCPMGCDEGLIIGEGGRIWCGNLLCPQPDAAARILEDAETEHLVTFDGDGFTIRHPLRERLDDELMSCLLHQWCATLRPDLIPPPGAYRALETPGGWIWERLPT
jgi:hypothetical protein